MKTRFEWNPTKAASNLRKHGVSFQTAARVFTDPFALAELDRIEDGEERWQTIGVVEGVLMAHIVRERDDIEVIRIISARPANRGERRRYEEENG